MKLKPHALPESHVETHNSVTPDAQTLNVLLLRPPPRESGFRGLLMPPLGLAWLAAVLETKGYRVTILDALAEGLSWQALSARVHTLKPDVLGISTMTPVKDLAYRAASLLRPLVKHIVLGGPHPTAVGALALEECPDLDSLILGEGEETLPLLLETLVGGGFDALSHCAPIPGVVTRQWEGGAGIQPDPECLPFPARRLLPNHRYRYPLATHARVTSLITSRGCPWHCTFCDQSVTGRKWRARSPEHVLDELRQIEQEGFRYVCIYDDNFTLDPDRVARLCEGMLRQGLKLDWKCEARVDGVSRELLQLMRRAGCRTIAYGLETANPEGLAALRKDSSVAEAEAAFRWTRRAGIEILAYVLLGIPGETPALARNTLDFCRREGVHYVQFSTLSAIPGTALYAEAQEKGWIPGVSIRSPLDDDLERSTLVAPGWTESSLRHMVWEAWARFYLHPRFLTRHALRSVRSGTAGLQVRGVLEQARQRFRA